MCQAFLPINQLRGFLTDRICSLQLYSYRIKCIWYFLSIRDYQIMYEYEYTVKSYFDILIKKYCVFVCMQNATKICKNILSR